MFYFTNRQLGLNNRRFAQYAVTLSGEYLTHKDINVNVNEIMKQEKKRRGVF